MTHKHNSSTCCAVLPLIVFCIAYSSAFNINNALPAIDEEIQSTDSSFSLHSSTEKPSSNIHTPNELLGRRENNSRSKRSPFQRQNDLKVYDKNGHPLESISLKNLYAFVNKRTGFAFASNDVLSIWNSEHWFEFQNSEAHSAVNGYELGSYKINSEGLSTFVYRSVQISHSYRDYYFLHPIKCLDPRPGSKFFSNRNDHEFVGTFCGLDDYTSSTVFNLENFQYKLVPFADYVKRFYDINAHMYNFEFKTPPEELLTSHKKQVNLIESHVLTNCHAGRHSEEITYSETRREGVSVQTSKSVSESSKSFSSFDINFAFRPSVSFAGFGVSGPEFSFTTHFGSESSRDETHRTDSSITKDKESTISIRKTINMEPFSCAHVSAYADRIDNLQLEYNALIGIRITDKNDKGLDFEKSEYILRNLRFTEKFSYVSDDGTLIYNTSGKMSSTFGIKSAFTVSTPLPEQCPCSYMVEDNVVQYS